MRWAPLRQKSRPRPRAWRKKGWAAPLWVVDFPMFEYDEESREVEGRATTPSPAPRTAHEAFIENRPGGRPTPRAYDMVLNGLGSRRRLGAYPPPGKCSSRCSAPFGKFLRKDQQAKFGFLLQALQYGRAAARRYIAFGFDRLVTLMAGARSDPRRGSPSRRPSAARDLVTGAPSAVTERQPARAAHPAAGTPRRSEAVRRVAGNCFFSPVPLVFLQVKFVLQIFRRKPAPRSLLIRKGGPYPYERDGRDLQQLSEDPAGRARSAAGYREYTVRNTGKEKGHAARGASSPAAMVRLYYTDDHYRSFRRILE